MSKQPLLKHASQEQKALAGDIARHLHIYPQPCELCGSSRNAVRHHDDYSKPRKIRWLCPQHHSDRHKVLRFLYGIKIDNHNWKHPRHPVNHENRRISKLAKLIEVLQILLRERFGLNGDRSDGSCSIYITGKRIDMTDESCRIVARGSCQIITILRRKRRKR